MVEMQIDNYGHYKLWHAGGSLLVAISFSSVFGGCWVCAIFGTYSRLATTIAYSVFAAIFNVGWAATQVSHMYVSNSLETCCPFFPLFRSERNILLLMRK